jgi:hypothetical protein
MSMSQEEIEALMNGLDISENENSESDDTSSEEKDSENMSEHDIADLIAETNLSNTSKKDSSEENINFNNEANVETKENNASADENVNIETKEENSESVSDVDIDALLNSIDDAPLEDTKEDDTHVSNEEIDTLLNDAVLDNESDKNSDVDTSEIDDLIAGLENEKDSTVDLSDEEDYLKDLNLNLDAESLDEIDKVEEEPTPEPEITTSSSKKRGNDVVNVEQINIPNQLGEVANDSEEKATKIFDALSYILEDNEELRKTTKLLDVFIQSQYKMLETLNKKFPNVKEFSENFESVKELIDKPKEIQTRLHNRDKELFETMELMQFHDINRQKIERVMGLVINLSRQLNSIFDDETNSINVANPNHLPGDKSDELLNSDDLESLIAEFGK